jgi:hypothetical protein
MYVLRPALALLPLLAPLATSAACLEDRGDGKGAGYVVGSAASTADTVRIAWLYQDPGDSSLRASLHGEVQVEGGAFDLDALLESVGDFDFPVRTCLAPVPLQDSGGATDEDGEEEAAEVAVGGIVATAGVPPSQELDGAELSGAVLAAARDVAAVWSGDDVPRDSSTGQRLESSLTAGLQLARLRPCRVPVECQGVEDVVEQLGGRPDPDLCLDPWPDDGVVLLQPATFGR